MEEIYVVKNLEIKNHFPSIEKKKMNPKKYRASLIT